MAPCITAGCPWPAGHQVDWACHAEVWTYAFAAHPAPHGWESAMYELFRYGTGMMERDFTQAQWTAFRESLARQGIELHEVTRRRASPLEAVL